MHPNAALLEKFYSAFSRRDAATMAQCYAPDATFQDPAFQLKGAECGAMWTMLCSRGKDLKVEFRDISADDASGKAHWEAWYSFTLTGRKVHNIIDAEFTFRDGLIATHRDHFDFYRWSKQALGLPGLLLGWTGFLQKKMQEKAMGNLRAFMAKSAS